MATGLLAHSAQAHVLSATPPLSPHPAYPTATPCPLIAQPQWKLLPGNRLSYDTHSAVTGRSSAQFVAPTRRQLPRDNTEGNSTAGSPIAPRGNVKPVVIYIFLIKELTLTVGGNRISQMFLGSFVSNKEPRRSGAVATSSAVLFRPSENFAGFCHTTVFLSRVKRRNVKTPLLQAAATHRSRRPARRSC